MRPWTVGVAAALLSMGAAHACIFELGEVVTTGVGGAAGSGGSGGSSVGARQIRIDLDGTQVSESLTNVPIMVALDSQRFDYAAAATDGADVHFVDTNGMPLAHEVEVFDPQGRSIFWVKLPQLSAGSDISFFLRYGGSTVGQQIAAVWSHYEAVYHFHDDIAAGVLSDRSGNGHDGDASALSPSQRVPGQIGSAAGYLDGMLQGSVAVPASTTDVGGELYIGGELPSQGAAYHGNLDEVRIARSADSAGWVALQYASMTDTLLSFAAPEPVP